MSCFFGDFSIAVRNSAQAGHAGCATVNRLSGKAANFFRAEMIVERQLYMVNLNERRFLAEIKVRRFAPYDRGSIKQQIFISLTKSITMISDDAEDSDVIRHLVNNRPEERYSGLTFNEIHRLTFEAYDADSPLHINPAIPNEILDRLPFFRLTEELLKIITRDGYIKLTPLGALPKKTLTELYSHRFILEYGVESGIHKLTREVDSNALSALHRNTTLAGLASKRHGKLTLTKAASRILSTGRRVDLFVRAWRAYTEKLPWSKLDGYPSLPVGNLGWAYTIYMLLQEGDTPHEVRYYASKYLLAFPEFLQTFPERRYGTVEENLIGCYSLRTFERFLEWWGFVKKTQEPRSWLEKDQTPYVATPALKEVFRVSG